MEKVFKLAKFKSIRLIPTIIGGDVGAKFGTTNSVKLVVSSIGDRI